MRDGRESRNTAPVAVAGTKVGSLSDGEKLALLGNVNVNRLLYEKNVSGSMNECPSLEVAFLGDTCML